MLGAGTASQDGDATPLWILLGGAAGIALWLLLRPKPAAAPGITQAAPVAPLRPPEGYPTIGAVSVRFGQVKELYRMGYLTPEQAMSEMQTLSIALLTLSRRGVGEPVATEALVDQMSSFVKDVERFMAERAASAA